MAIVNDISLGHYYPNDSFVHRLDPRTKILAITFIMAALLFTLDVLVLASFSVFSILFILFSRLPVNLVLRNLRPFLLLFLITMLVHLFWTEGEALAVIPYVNWEISREGINLGAIYTLRLGLLIVFTAVLSLSTSPIELTDALEKMLAPLKKIKVPSHEIVMMLTLSLRFIPTLLEEAERIKNAQISRGASFDGSLVKRAKSIVPLVLPLFVSAFRRADELAYAMDSRCYTGGEGRTTFKELRFQASDIVVLFCVTLVCVGAVLIS
jgi:energy-coupling factor transport system permease protein